MNSACWLPSLQREDEERKKIIKWIEDLCELSLRDKALEELAKCHGYKDLAIWLWHSFGAVASLIQVITAYYPIVIGGAMSINVSVQLCNALSLLQVIASHPETKLPFAHSEIISLLLPMVGVEKQTPAMENVRVAIANVIGNLIQTQSEEIVSCFMSSGFMSMMSVLSSFLVKGSTVCKSIASFILCRILEHNVGLAFFIADRKACLHLVLLLAKVINNLSLEPIPQVLKMVISCYNRLTTDKYAQALVHMFLPQQLRNNNFQSNIKEYAWAKADIDELNKKVTCDLSSSMMELISKDSTIMEMKNDSNSFSSSLF